MSDCCYVCGDSRESMDPFDKYPDMGWWQLLRNRRTAWICDVCTEEFDSTTEGCV